MDVLRGFRFFERNNIKKLTNNIKRSCIYVARAHAGVPKVMIRNLQAVHPLVQANCCVQKHSPSMTLPTDSEGDDRVEKLFPFLPLRLQKYFRLLAVIARNNLFSANRT